MNLGVFASGGGTNFQAVLDAVDRGDLPIRVALCLSNKADAGALERAKKHGVAAVVFDHTLFDDDASYAAAMLQLLAKHDVDFIALAGYMRKIPSEVVAEFSGRIINIHPALLPAFGGKGLYGRRIHEAVLAYGVRWTGVTVHLVDEEYDTGPIVLQEPVTVLPGDTAEQLAARVLDVEHRLYPEALRLFAQNRVRVAGRHVMIEPQPATEPR